VIEWEREEEVRVERKLGSRRRAKEKGRERRAGRWGKKDKDDGEEVVRSECRKGSGQHGGRGN